MIKTRVKDRGDGTVEVVRVLSLDAMDRMKMDDPLAYEKSIVWLEDIQQLPFVRVGMISGAKSRRGPLHATGNGRRIVGYAKLTENAPKEPGRETYTRRYFYVKDSDLQGSEHPESAIDPRSVTPGVAGNPPASE